VKIEGKFDLQPYQNSPLFFTECKLRPPGIGIETTVAVHVLDKSTACGVRT